MDDPPQHATGPAAPEDAAGDHGDVPAPDSLRSVELDDALRRRSSPRTRLLAFIASAAGLVLVTLLVLRALPPLPARESPDAPARPPRPMPATIALTSTVAYGRVTLNGRKLPDAPPLLIHPRQGDNVVMVSAPPFASHVCAFRWDADSGAFSPLTNTPANTCSTADADPGFIIRGVAVRWAVEVTFAPADLAPDALTQATQAVGAELAALHLTTIVPPGDFIATGRDLAGAISTQRASSPLAATVALAMPAPSDPHGPITCPLALCPGIVQQTVAAGGERLWQVAVAPSYRWHFTDTAGRTITSPAYSGGLIQVTLAWTDTGWRPASSGLILPSRVNESPAALLCAGGLHELDATFHSSPNGGTEGGYGPGVEGCLILRPQAGGEVPATFVWRFGVLLAAGSVAHALQPTLPLAPPAELAVVSAL